MHESAPLRPPWDRRLGVPSRLAPLALLGVLACAPPPLPEVDTGPGAPSIRITWPPPESVISGCAIVTVEVENFDLVEFPSEDIVEGEGHYHIYHPGGYAACYKPYCLVDFSDVTETNEPFLTAVLANTAHDEIVDDNGDLIQDKIPFDFAPGDCAISTGD